MARDLGITQKTAWFILHKVRGLYGQDDSVALEGEVEIDEMYLGGRETTYKDEASIYGKLGENGYKHLFVNHEKREFVRSKDIHTNSIEGFLAHFKRVVFSTYHIVRKDYLQRYIDEQVYRWNTREESASYRLSDMFDKPIGLVRKCLEIRVGLTIY